MRSFYILLLSLTLSWSWGDSDRKVSLQYQEALVGIVKVSGFFDRHISSDFSLHEIINFLSSRGVTVNVLKVWRNDPFTERDGEDAWTDLFVTQRG